MYSTIERNQDKILRSKAASIAEIKNQVDGREAIDVVIRNIIVVAKGDFSAFSLFDFLLLDDERDL